MHILTAVAILGAIVIGINVLTILANHFLTRGDVQDRLKVLEARLPKASAEPLIHSGEVDWTTSAALGYSLDCQTASWIYRSHEETADILTAKQRDFLFLVATEPHQPSLAIKEGYEAALADEQGFTNCVHLGWAGGATRFVPSSKGWMVADVLGERRKKAELSDPAKRMECSAERFVHSCQRVEDRLTFLIDALQEQVMRKVKKKTRKTSAKAS